MLDHNLLYKSNRSRDELIQLLSPHINVSNRELFYRKSKNQKGFNQELISKGLLPNSKNYPELDKSLSQIQSEVSKVLEKAEKSNYKKQSFDFDFAKIFHSNLKLSKRSVIDYDFWRYITLFYFIEVTKWRWEKDPEKSSNWVKNAKSIFSRSLGLSFDLKKYENENVLDITLRNQRINAFRYWWLGDKLYDKSKGYFYLDKLSEIYKNEDVAVQDFLNHLEGNKLTSFEDRISKLFVNNIFLSGKKFSETDTRKAFNRYNAFKNRKFMDADEITFSKEVCLLE